MGALATALLPDPFVGSAGGGIIAADAGAYDIPALVDHIVERYHRVHLHDLACAIELAEQVEEVSADIPDCPRGLVDRLRQLSADLEAHQRREEFSLFPLLRLGTPRCLDFVTRRMADDHAEVDLHVMALHAFNTRHQPSLEAPLCWQALAFLCRKLEEDLREHARLEHEVLYAALQRRAAA
jgi:regulator of cell morphogenesis and NO signaling